MAMECQTHKPAWLPEEQGGYPRRPAEWTGALLTIFSVTKQGRSFRYLQGFLGPPSSTWQETAWLFHVARNKGK